MPNKKGFTLTELLVVMVIIGITASVGMSNYNIMIQQGAAKASQNNLITIYNAEKTYYLNNGYYCVIGTSCSGSSCCGNLNDINTTLSLNITDNYFSYICEYNSFAGGYGCFANGSEQFIVILTSPIIVLGGNGTLGQCNYANYSNYGGGYCNPSCMVVKQGGLCPTN